jgi:pimeloyl-ACP methyl ester carboxylesterase
MKILKRVFAMLIVLLIFASVFLFEGDIPAAEVDAKYSNAESQFLVMGNGARVHYRDQGKQDGVPLVLVHGAMASLHTWEPWVESLGSRYRIITLDLPAHGLTGAVPSGEYGADAFTQTIDAVVDKAGLDTFVLGGNSMGGGATWRYALENPQRVSAMVLVDSVPPTSWQGNGEDSVTRRSGPVGFSLLRQGWFRAIAGALDPAPLIKQGLRAAYNDSPVVTDDLIDRYYELIMREGTRAAILGRTASYGETEAESSDLSLLTQPTLVIWGAQDSVIPVSAVEIFEATLPNVRTVIFDDLGHIPMEEDPQRTAAAVASFIDSL